MSLDEPQIRRYSRHVLLPDVGGVGQERLLRGAVRVRVGPARIAELVALSYLAAAGVGTLVVEGAAQEPPEADELRWGLVYGAGDTARSRLHAIRARLEALNPDVTITTTAPAHAISLDPIAPVDNGSGCLADALVAGGLAASRALHRLIRGEA